MGQSNSRGLVTGQFNPQQSPTVCCSYAHSGSSVSFHDLLLNIHPRYRIAIPQVIKPLCEAKCGRVIRLPPFALSTDSSRSIAVSGAVSPFPCRTISINPDSDPPYAFVAEMVDHRSAVMGFTCTTPSVSSPSRIVSSGFHILVSDPKSGEVIEELPNDVGVYISRLLHVPSWSRSQVFSGGNVVCRYDLTRSERQTSVFQTGRCRVSGLSAWPDQCLLCVGRNDSEVSVHGSVEFWSVTAHSLAGTVRLPSRVTSCLCDDAGYLVVIGAYAYGRGHLEIWDRRKTTKRIRRFCQTSTFCELQPARAAQFCALGEDGTLALCSFAGKVIRQTSLPGPARGMCVFGNLDEEEQIQASHSTSIESESEDERLLYLLEFRQLCLPNGTAEGMLIQCPKWILHSSSEIWKKALEQT